MYPSMVGSIPIAGAPLVPSTVDIAVERPPPPCTMTMRMPADPATSADGWISRQPLDVIQRVSRVNDHGSVMLS